MKAGLLYRENHEIRSHFRAQRYRDLILFSDFHQWESDPDFVLPVGPAGHYLAQTFVRRPSPTALDLGCGCGILSLLATQDCQSVTASDVNPRALQLTSLNAQLNGIHNLEILKGSYFQPLGDRRFHLILANLPFYITPQGGHRYRDIQAEGNASILERVRQFPLHLMEGGFAHLLINWIHEEGQDPFEPIRSALSGIGADVWLVHNGSKTPEEYIGMWADHHLRDNPQRYEKQKRDWLNWYQVRGIRQIALGALTLRKRTAVGNWLEAVSVRGALQGPASDQTLRIIAMQERMDAYQHSEQILEETLQPVEMEVRKGEANGSFIACATHGQPIQARISPPTARLLKLLAGEASPRAIMQRISNEAPDHPGEDEWRIIIELQSLAKLGMLEVKTGGVEIPERSQNDAG